MVSERALRALLAIATLAAVALMSTNRIQVGITPKTQLIAGMTSGFIGTAAGLCQPTVARLDSRETGPALRVTLVFVTLVGNAASLVEYWIADHLTPVDVTLSGVFLTPTLLGLGVGILVLRCLHDTNVRRVVFVVVTFSAVVLLARARIG